MRLSKFIKKIIIVSSTLTFTLCVGVTFGTAQGTTTPASQQPIPSDTVITLRRADCFLTCPDYLVTVSADGSVMFEGYGNVKVKGKVQSHISREKVQLLISAFLNAKYFSLRDQYFGHEDGCRKVWPDSSSATTSILISGKSKSIDHYLGCHRSGETSYPKVLTNLEEMIDELANTRQWIE